MLYSDIADQRDSELIGWATIKSNFCSPNLKTMRLSSGIKVAFILKHIYLLWFETRTDKNKTKAAQFILKYIMASFLIGTSSHKLILFEPTITKIFIKKKQLYKRIVSEKNINYYFFTFKTISLACIESHWMICSFKLTISWNKP